MFRATLCSSSGGRIVLMQHLVQYSVLSDLPVCRFSIIIKILHNVIVHHVGHLPRVLFLRPLYIRFFTIQKLASYSPLAILFAFHGMCLSPTIFYLPISDVYVALFIKYFFLQCHHMSFVDFVVLPPGHGRSVTDF